MSRRASAALRRVLLALLLLAAAGCATAPPHLPAVKSQLVGYVESGRYERELSAAVARARRYLEAALPASIARGERPAIVLDIDETSLSNWGYERELDFGFSLPTWTEWVERAEAEPIEPTLELYRFAVADGAAVFFVTGRQEGTREATEGNLKAVGYEAWADLVMRPEDGGGVSTVEYKVAARRAIAERGYSIVLNLGDQRSDLEGGHAARAFKLPNPFYGN